MKKYPHALEYVGVVVSAMSVCVCVCALPVAEHETEICSEKPLPTCYKFQIAQGYSKWKRNLQIQIRNYSKIFENFENELIG